MQVQTSCKGCVFAEYEGDMQNGCKLNRSEKMNPKSDFVLDGHKHHYTFSRFCNTYRPDEWKLILSDEEKEDLTKTVMSEVCPRVGIFVFLDDSEDMLTKLKHTLDGIKNQTFGAIRYVVLINQKVEYNAELHDILLSYFDFEKTEFHIVQTLIKDKNAFLLDEAFIHAKNGWAYVTSCGEKIDEKLLENIHDRINLQMKRLVIVEPYEDLNGLIFQTAIYKFLDGNRKLKHKETGEDIVISFMDKAKSMKTEDPDTFITWEQFVNESS